MKEYSPIKVVINDGSDSKDTSEESLINFKQKQCSPCSVLDHNQNGIEANEVTRLLRRRRLTLMSILVIFLLAGAILTVSVVYDVRKRAEMSEATKDGWEEIVCTQDDMDCLKSLCPVGMEWNQADRICDILQGWRCCTLCIPGFKCFPEEESEDPDNKCCKKTGVVPSTYKQTCQDGFLWVEWKRVCVRKN